MAWWARSVKSRFSARFVLVYFFFTFIWRNPFLYYAIFFYYTQYLLLFDSKSSFIRRSPAKHFGYPPFFDHKSATKPPQSHKAFHHIPLNRKSLTFSLFLSFASPTKPIKKLLNLIIWTLSIHQTCCSMHNAQLRTILPTAQPALDLTAM